MNGNTRRSQDLDKRPLLCGNCESILNESETFFANTIFYPFKHRTLKTVPVDDRIARFAVSVSLRTLWIMQLIEHPLVEKWKEQLDGLEDEWRKFLLHKPDFVIGANSHHIVLSDESGLTAGLKGNPNLIFGILRTAAYYLFEKFGKAYVFANLAGVQVISMIYPAYFPVSRGTQVYPVQTFGIETPPSVGWGGYYQNLIELAKLMDESMDRLSHEQKARIENAIGKDPARYTNSEDFRIQLMQQALLGSLEFDRDHET
jgi:hypothetical protein